MEGGSARACVQGGLGRPMEPESIAMVLVPMGSTRALKWLDKNHPNVWVRIIGLLSIYMYAYDLNLLLCVMLLSKICQILVHIVIEMLLKYNGKKEYNYKVLKNYVLRI